MLFRDLPDAPHRALDQHDFWLNQPKTIKLIGFNMLERNAGAKPRTLLLIPL